MKRKLSLILLLALMFSLVSCASDGKEKKDDREKETTAAVTTEAEGDFEPLSLPDLDYGGAKVRIVTSHSEETDKEIFAAELTNEPVNDSIYNRELFVEDLLSVELVRQLVEKSGISAHIDKMFTSGDIPGEIIIAPCADNAWRTPNGYYKDLRLLDNINPAAPWWSQNFNDEISVCDLLYLTCGDLSLSMLRNIYVIFFNKSLAEDNGITNVYDLVFDGDWTIDTATELSSGIYKDINGNSEADDEDIYGFMTAPMMGDPSWSAFEIDILSKDENGLLVFEPELEKFGIAHEKLCKLFDLKSTYTRDWFNTDSIYKFFASGQALFACSKLMMVETEDFRNMQNDYGILPMMKLDKSQKEYHTMPHDDYNAFGISSMLDDETAEMAAAVLEAMGWYSYRYVKPAYLDIAMKGKYANDQETRQMIDMVMDGMRIDAAWMYAYPLLDYPQEWRYLLDDRGKSYASEFEQKDRRLRICLKELNGSFENIANG